MKMFSKVAIAAIAVTMASTSAQAQRWTNTAGTTLPNGTAVTATGQMDVAVFGGFGRKICTVSISGTVTAPGTITFTQSTPGFVSNCDSDNEGATDFPFNVNALIESGVDKANVPSITFNTPVGSCTGSLKFNWADSTTSRGTLPANKTVGICTVYATTSWLQTSGALAGAVDIRP